MQEKDLNYLLQVFYHESNLLSKMGVDGLFYLNENGKKVSAIYANLINIGIELIIWSMDIDLLEDILDAEIMATCWGNNLSEDEYKCCLMIKTFLILLRYWEFKKIAMLLDNLAQRAPYAQV